MPGNAGAGQGAPGGRCVAGGREELTGVGPSRPGMRVFEVWGKGGGSAPFWGDVWGFWSSGVGGGGPPGAVGPVHGEAPPMRHGPAAPRPAGGRGCVGDAVVGGRRWGGGPWGVPLPVARLPLSRYLARPGAEV